MDSDVFAIEVSLVHNGCSRYSVGVLATWNERVRSLGAADAVPRIAHDDLRAFEHAVSLRRPVLVERAVAHWPAMRMWSLASLQERHGDARLSAYRVVDGRLVFDDRTGLVQESIALGAFLADVAASKPLRHRIRDRILPQSILADVPPPLHCRDRLRLQTNLWVSAANTVSRVHYDQPEGLLAAVMGTKRVMLFAPSEKRNLYPYPPWSPSAQFAQVDLDQPDMRRFPRLARARGAIAELVPGDALYLPGGHWHYVESDEVTISIGFRWWRYSDLPRLVLADLYKRLRGHTR